MTTVIAIRQRLWLGLIVSYVPFPMQTHSAVFQIARNSAFHGQKLVWSTNPVRTALPKRSTLVSSKGLYPIRERASAVEDSNNWLSKRALATWNRYIISTVAAVSLTGALFISSVSGKTTPDAFVLNGSKLEEPTAMIQQEQSQMYKADTSLVSNLYRIYDNKGNKIDLNSLFSLLRDRQVVLIGETHDDSVAHELELAIVKYLYELQDAGNDMKPLVVSLEFFDYDMQGFLDSYIEKKITEPEFLKACMRQPDNIEDYLPLLRFCRERRIPVLASNAPRHIIERVRKDGKEYLNSLKEEESFGIPPLPYPAASESYEAKFMALMNHQLMLAAHGMWKDDLYTLSKQEGFQRRLNNYLEAQNLWDASMAYNIVNKIQENPRATVCHICGKFHMEGGLGIPEHLHNYAPHLNLVSVTIVPEESMTCEETKKDAVGFLIRTRSSD
ncbi:hypothetical protein GAYE_SCF04G2491 [Galdieria yellowstonensis]|uniref:Haem-binding uptake Tiki superfamily ChaN domain-containing protein n=1 Tax=Galdieria yellowstonensis TaxID=3028027 RepID=A0AAV9IAY4_9RHOD|nr:hypothetical protein GAYE_SCF04G2491 [Galdieria yellowstonensis]